MPRPVPLARASGRPGPGRAPIVALALAVCGVLLTGCGTTMAGDAPRATPSELAQQVATEQNEPSPAPDASLAQNALAVLDTIDVRPRTEWDGPFDRVESFGEGWGDPDGNGCNARNDALQEAMTDVELRSDGCRVAAGTFTDPYSGETVSFVAGPVTSEAVQIDHVVALYNAWRTGAQSWSFEQRVAFSNDPLNLQPTLHWVNDDKMASDASQWLPPNAAYRCTYVARQIAVKATYGLWVTQDEYDAMGDVLDGCR